MDDASKRGNPDKALGEAVPEAEASQGDSERRRRTWDSEGQSPLRLGRHVVFHIDRSDHAKFVFYEEDLPRIAPRYQLVLRLRAGLADGRRHSLREVGERLGVTQERARQLQTVALRECRKVRRSA